MLHVDKDASLRMELDDMYVSLDFAREEIVRRWNDKNLKQRVEGLLTGDMPEILRLAPRAVISRHVMSPNFELLNFLGTAKELGLQPAGLEYTYDKFVSKNEDKYYLGKLVFFEGLGKKGGEKLSSLKVIDFDLCDGKKIADIKTAWDQDFVTFHHELVYPFLGPENIVDMSEYYRRNGLQASHYYKYILSLFICHGVLFENFLLSDIYKELTEEILLPSLKEVTSIYGIKPLIVRLVPSESEEDIHWRQYPLSIKERASDIMTR
ncbi:MAG: hypothetical protein ACEQSB_05615 [Undibacterium sp.]